MSSDRRRHPRTPHLRKATFRWWGREVTGATTDLSAGGAFVTAAEVPDVGTRVTIWFDAAPGAPRIELRARVVRSVPRGFGDEMGFALRWLQARTYGTAAQLRAFLADTFG